MKPIPVQEALAAHLPFMSFFYLKDDLTIFRLVEKKFEQGTVRAHVLNHPELIKTISFNEPVYWLYTTDLAAISSIVMRKRPTLNSRNLK